MSELLRPFLGEHGLAPAQLQALQAYVALLMRWNARTNLTAVRGEENIVLRHIGESLFTANHLLPNASTSISVIDVGSGAGFPGLPLKVYAPGIDLTLIESQNKKVTFLREAVRGLHLDRVRVFAGRAETFESKADLVTMRAVEHFETVVTIAASLVRPQSYGSTDKRGRLALMIGQGQVEKAESLLSAFMWSEPVAIPLSAARVLLVGQREPE